MIAIANRRRSSDVGPTSEYLSAAAAGHMIVPFADSRRRPDPPEDMRSSGVPSSSSRRRVPPDPPAAISDHKGHSRKKTPRRHSTGEDLIVGFPESKPDSCLGVLTTKNTKKPEQARTRRSLQTGPRYEDTDWRQTSIDWGDEDDNVYNSKTTSLSTAAQCNGSCTNQSVELVDSSTRSFSQSFSSFLGIRNNQVANQSA